MLYWCLSNVLEALELAAEARAGFEKAVELDPQFGLGWWSLGLHDAVCKRPAEARAAAEKGFAIHPESPYNIGLLAGVLGNAGETTQSEALLERLPTGTAGASVARSCFHLVRGESDAAVQCAGAALDEGYLLAPCMFVLPFERLLRQSPGWRTLMRKLNLPESR